MFDIGFSELLLFGVIALIVLGPEKLPQAARTAGQWYAKIRRTVSTLQSEIEAELDLAETRQQMQKELAKIRQTEADMKREMAEMRGNMKAFESSQNHSIKATPDSGVTEKNGQIKSGDVNKTNMNHGGAITNSDMPDHNQPAKPKAFDYTYASDTPDKETSENTQISKRGINDDGLDIADGDDTVSVIQTIVTRPWENMWFRLGAYDKARRLPMPPYVPNYKADVLLNDLLNPVLNQQLSTNTQEAD